MRRKDLGTFFCILYMDDMDYKKSSESSKKFECKICDYSTCRNSQYVRHCLSVKHIRMTKDDKSDVLSSKKVPYIYSCDCGNVYKYRQGLSKHRKICKNEVIVSPVSNGVLSNEFILEFMKQEKEFKITLIETLKNGMGNKNSHNNNSHNNTKNKFNINLFLNEKCKDAMNIMDFVNTMQLELSDLEKVGEEGYVKGISDIIVNKLKDLDVYKRPIHCSDVKRETMYVKDKDAWAKDEAKEKITKMVKHISHKNQKQIGEWQQENPDYKDSESTKCDEYLKIVVESMNGLTNDVESNGYTNKIIKNIAKEITVKDE